MFARIIKGDYTNNVTYNREVVSDQAQDMLKKLLEPNAA
jgi:hypothetical protein